MLDKLPRTIELTTEEMAYVGINAIELFKHFKARTVIKEVDGDIERNWQNAITAQAGEAILSIIHTGNIQLYMETRDIRNAHPNDGDGGSDLIGYKHDMKARIRTHGPDQYYYLYVPNHQFHPDTTYFLCLFDIGKFNVGHVMGWCRSNQLIKGEKHWYLRQDKLNRMRTIQELGVSR
jgi:hypothetical protein